MCRLTRSSCPVSLRSRSCHRRERTADSLWYREDGITAFANRLKAFLNSVICLRFETCSVVVLLPPKSGGRGRGEDGVLSEGARRLPTPWLFRVDSLEASPSAVLRHGQLPPDASFGLGIGSQTDPAASCGYGSSAAIALMGNLGRHFAAANPYVQRLRDLRGPG
jgi:hypothetical protein